MSAADNPPDRARLAGLLRVLARPGDHAIGEHGKRAVADYVKIAEDTIEAQAAMLRADLTELASHRRGRADDAEAVGALRREVDRLRDLVIEGIDAALAGDGAAIAAARRAALERTS